MHLFVRFLAKLGAPLSSELLNTLIKVGFAVAVVRTSTSRVLVRGCVGSCIVILLFFIFLKAVELN